MGPPVSHFRVETERYAFMRCFLIVYRACRPSHEGMCAKTDRAKESCVYGSQRWWRSMAAQNESEGQR